MKPAPCDDIREQTPSNRKQSPKNTVIEIDNLETPTLQKKIINDIRTREKGEKESKIVASIYDRHSRPTRWFCKDEKREIREEEKKWTSNQSRNCIGAYCGYLDGIQGRIKEQMEIDELKKSTNEMS